MLFFKICYHINSIIKKIFYKMIYGNRIKFGKGVNFRKNFTIVVEGKGKIEIGSNTFFNNYCSINAKEFVKIGENCLFGENVKIYDHDHNYKVKEKPIRTQGFKCKEVFIGDNCWIGSNSVILRGVQIGEHCVIGAGEIVRNNIESDSLVINSTIKKI